MSTISDEKLDDFLKFANALMAGGGDAPPGMLLQPETVRALVQEVKDRRYIEKHPVIRLDTCE